MSIKDARVSIFLPRGLIEGDDVIIQPVVRSSGSVSLDGASLTLGSQTFPAVGTLRWKVKKPARRGDICSLKIGSVIDAVPAPAELEFAKAAPSSPAGVFTARGVLLWGEPLAIHGNFRDLPEIRIGAMNAMAAARTSSSIVALPAWPKTIVEPDAPIGTINDSIIDQNALGSRVLTLRWAAEEARLPLRIIGLGATYEEALNFHGMTGLTHTIEVLASVDGKAAGGVVLGDKTYFRLKKSADRIAVKRNLRPEAVRGDTITSLWPRVLSATMTTADGRPAWVTGVPFRLEIAIGDRSSSPSQLVQTVLKEWIVDVQTGISSGAEREIVNQFSRGTLFREIVAANQLKFHTDALSRALVREYLYELRDRKAAPGKPVVAGVPIARVAGMFLSQDGGTGQSTAIERKDVIAFPVASFLRALASILSNDVGYLVVQSDPDGLQTWIDGRQRGGTKIERVLSAGEHKVKVASGDRQVCEHVVRIGPNETTPLFCGGGPQSRKLTDRLMK